MWALSLAYRYRNMMDPAIEVEALEAEEALARRVAAACAHVTGWLFLGWCVAESMARFYGTGGNAPMAAFCELWSEVARRLLVLI